MAMANQGAWWLWCLVFVAFAVGLVLAHLYWPLERRLDDEFDRGYGVGWKDAIRRNDGQDTGDDRETSEDHESGVPDLRGVDGQAVQAAERPDLGDPARLEEAGNEGSGQARAGVTGHTIYTELTALDVQDIADEVAEAEAAVDPDWHPAFLARSDAWLAEWRANLGLEEAA